MSNSSNTLFYNSDSGNKTSKEQWKEVVSISTFLRPNTLPPSAWTEHIPFAFWLTCALKPNFLVELGTHFGLSYFAFCQVVQQFNLPTKCFAVDNWQGDEHAGFYDENVFHFVQETNEHYAGFSRLIRTTFDDAKIEFADNSIDLLHIDGLHTYEAAKHDFYNWLPKMSTKGVILLHDTNVRNNGFGVYQLWEEITQLYPHFEFKHESGLGIIAVGTTIPESLLKLFDLYTDNTAYKEICEIYERLGHLWKLEQYLYQRSYPPNGSQTDLHTERFHLENISVNSLSPLRNVLFQIYWADEDETFIESRSTIQSLILGHEKLEHSIKLNQDISSLKRLRIDPATQKGIYYLHSISLADDSGKIIMYWQDIKQECTFFNLSIFRSTLKEDSFLLICLTDDPIIEITLPDFSIPGNRRAASLLISISAIEADSLSVELSNITNSEIHREPVSSHKETHSLSGREVESGISQFYQFLTEAKEKFQVQLSSYISIKQTELTFDKNSLLKEFKNLKNLFEIQIAQAAKTIDGKEVRIAELLTKTEVLVVERSELNFICQAQNKELLELNNAYRMNLAEMDDLRQVKDKYEIEIKEIKSILSNLSIEIESKNSIIGKQTYDRITLEERMRSVENKLHDLQSKSILQFIKEKLYPPKSGE